MAVGQEVVRSDRPWRFAAAMAVTAADHQTEFSEPVVVYNIEVANAHTYFVGKWMWWVHNASGCVSKLVKEGVDAAKKVIKRRPKVPKQPVLDAAGNLTKYGKWHYDRPFKFRKGVRDEVWDKANNADGHVIDPVSGNKMSEADPWDMGHKPGYEFRKHQKSAAEREIERKKFLEEHNNSDHYGPENPSSNRSHSREDHTSDYFGY